MQELLTNKLHHYISENHADLFIQLEEAHQTISFLRDKVLELDSLISKLKSENKPEYIIEEICMEELTKDLRSGKYDYIKNILEEEFEFVFNVLQNAGILQYEIINIINYSETTFETFDFNEGIENNRVLRYAVIGMISEYLSK